MCQALEDDRAARELAHLAHHLSGRRARRERLERMPDAFLHPELRQLAVQDLSVHRLGDGDELHLLFECDQRDVPSVRCVDQLAGHLVESADELDPDPAHAGLGQLTDIAGQLVAILGEPHARREEKLSASQVLGRVGHVGDVHPAHGSVESVAAGEDARMRRLDLFDLQDVGDGQHVGFRRPRDCHHREKDACKSPQAEWRWGPDPEARSPRHPAEASHPATPPRPATPPPRRGRPRSFALARSDRSLPLSASERLGVRGARGEVRALGAQV